MLLTFDMKSALVPCVSDIRINQGVLTFWEGQKSSIASLLCLRTGDLLAPRQAR